MIKITNKLLGDIEAKAKAATPGPWQWHNEARRTNSFGNGVILFATRSMRPTVLDFVRDGMCGAAPRVNVNGIMQRFDPEHPDAAHIARCDPSTILALVAEVRRLRVLDQYVTEIVADIPPDCDAVSAARKMCEQRAKIADLERERDDALKDRDTYKGMLAAIEERGTIPRSIKGVEREELRQEVRRLGGELLEACLRAERAETEAKEFFDKAQTFLGESQEYKAEVERLRYLLRSWCVFAEECGFTIGGPNHKRLVATRAELGEASQ